ncbi:hypothetical protein L596_023858 [Steinernema carpocapsae]|uniref:BHLH domain-containing protein n=1 Tax=Steinernema carpocapsae TaxID=34508 RepID=A0A4U5MEX4_STECR|nr:hypothetical protein L596_023858 [Steinernema carpocapsae]
MTSNPHDEVDEEDEDVEVEVVDEEERNNDSRAESTIADRDEKPVTFYKFGPRKTQSIAIDVSLNKINKCLKVAYDKMTTPKWKDFKGLRLQCSQRIRLNNVIWRAYYLEFKRPKKIQKKTFCYFAVPDDDATHTKVGGSVLEGMYWKRRIKAVCAQYKRWRHYVPSKKKDVKPPRPRGRAESCGCDSERPCIPTNQSKTPPPNLGRGDFYFDEDDFFPDSILEGLDEPFWFPNAREIQSDNADTIQPGLLPLQGDVRDNIEQIKQWMVSADDNYSQPAPPLHPSKPQQQSRNTSEVTNPRSTGGYSTKDYDAASVLVDYSNQGTRHALPRASQADPSTAPAALSIPVTPALMSTPHMTQPFYSQAVYGAQQQPQNQFNHHTPAEGSPFDYTPQFLAAAVASSGASPFSPYSNMVLGGGQAAQHNTRAAWWVSTSNAAAAAHGHSINHHLQQQGLQPMKQLITDKPSSGGSPFSCDSLINFGGTEHLATTRVRAVSESIANLFQPASVSPFALPHELQLQQMQADSKNVISQHHSLRSIVDPQPAAKAWGTNAQHYLRSPAAVHQQLLPPHSQASIAMMRPTIQQPPAKIPRLDPAESIPQPLFPQISTQLMTSPTLTPGVVVNSTVPTVNDRVANGGLNMLGSVAAVAAAASTSANSAPLIKTEPLIQRKWSDSQTPSQTTTISPPLSVPPASQSASQGTKRRTLSTDANPASHPADSTVQPGDRKRMVHLKAEQNRRSALKDGFEQLMKIVPDLYSNGTKPTNAVVLAKAADRIRTLQDATSQFDGGEKELDDQIAKLQARISVLQANLPKKSRANSNKSPADQKTQIQNFFEKYTKERTKEDFRFWIMSQILENFIESFATSMTAVDTSSRTAISEQCHRWINEHLSNSELQPFCSQVLVTLITNTNLMETPETLKDDILNLGLVKKA